MRLVLEVLAFKIRNRQTTPSNESYGGTYDLPLFVDFYANIDGDLQTILYIYNEFIPNAQNTCLLFQD